MPESFVVFSFDGKSTILEVLREIHSNIVGHDKWKVMISLKNRECFSLEFILESIENREEVMRASDSSWTQQMEEFYGVSERVGYVSGCPDQIQLSPHAWSLKFGGINALLSIEVAGSDHPEVWSFNSIVKTMIVCFSKIDITHNTLSYRISGDCLQPLDPVGVVKDIKGYYQLSRRFFGVSGAEVCCCCDEETLYSKHQDSRRRNLFIDGNGSFRFEKDNLPSRLYVDCEDKKILARRILEADDLGERAGFEIVSYLDPSLEAVLRELNTEAQKLRQGFRVITQDDFYYDPEKLARLREAAYGELV